MFIAKDCAFACASVGSLGGYVAKLSECSISLRRMGTYSSFLSRRLFLIPEDGPPTHPFSPFHVSHRYNSRRNGRKRARNYYNNRRRLYRLKRDANSRADGFPNEPCDRINEIVPRVSVRAAVLEYATPREEEGAWRWDRTAAPSPKPPIYIYAKMACETRYGFGINSQKLSRDIAARNLSEFLTPTLPVARFPLLILVTRSFSDTVTKRGGKFPPEFSRQETRRDAI